MTSHTILTPAIRHIEPASGAGKSVIDRLKNSIIGKCYMGYFKKYRYIRSTIRWLWEHGYPLINRFLFYIGIMCGVSESYPLKNYSKYIDLILAEKHLYKKTQLVNTPLPMVFPVSAAQCFGRSNKKYDFPDIFISVIPASIVGGGTNFILSNEIIFHHELFDFNRDKTSEELHGRVLISSRSKRGYWRINDSSPVLLDKAATFLDACASNYAHWLTEVLPRIVLFCEDARFLNVPIIVNEGLHKNIMESLYIVAGQKREIIALPFGRCLKVEDLYVVSPTGYIPFGVRSMKKSNNPHGVFSPHALTKLVTKVQDFIGNGDACPPKKILIRRKTGIRSLANYIEIEKLLMDRGFVIIEPEKLNFSEQARVFSQADIVVGATGAALVNLMFCKPDTKIIILMAQHAHMPYWYWQNIACAVKCRTTYVLGNTIKSTGLGIHADFNVDAKDVIAAVDAEQ